jgi:hypothetical protein
MKWWCGEKRMLIHCWWGCKLVQTLWKAVWRLLKKLEIELPYDSVIPLLGIYPKECRTGYSTNNLYTNVHYSTIHKSQAFRNNTVALQLMNESRNCGIYTQWSITQLYIMTCGLKTNGCNWRTLYYVKLARIRNTKNVCFLSYVHDRFKDTHIHKKHDQIQTQT